MIKFTRDIMPWAFTILAIATIFMLYLGYKESKQSNNEVVEILKRASIPDTIFFTKKINKVVVQDTLIIHSNTVKGSIADLKVISSNTLDDTTMTFLFTFFSVTLLTAGVYLLSTTNNRLNDFEQQHEEMRDESLNLRYSLIMLSNVNSIHTLISDFKPNDIDMIIELREKAKTLKAILSSKKFSKLEDQVFSISSNKVEFVLNKIKELIENDFINDETKKKTFNSILLNLEKIAQLIENKDKETIIDMRKIKGF